MDDYNRFREKTYGTSENILHDVNRTSTTKEYFGVGKYEDANANYVKGVYEKVRGKHWMDLNFCLQMPMGKIVLKKMILVWKLFIYAQ